MLSMTGFETGFVGKHKSTKKSLLLVGTVALCCQCLQELADDAGNIQGHSADGTGSFR